MGTGKIGLWTKASLAVTITLFLTSGQAFAAPEIGEFKSDDGTYSIQSVTSVEECEALCKADNETCRGTVLYQPDTSRPEMECRLNDGFGQNAIFPRTPPTEIDYGKTLSDLNAYRVENGLRPLTYNEKLNRASEVHAKDLASADMISHTGTDGSGHGDRVQLQGYYFSIAAENVATGQKSWDAAFRSWKNSPGHNENLLRDDVTEFGIALAYAPKTSHATYWAMLVAHPLDIDHFHDGE